jgi:uncharacterized protein (TIGR02266 family)
MSEKKKVLIICHTAAGQMFLGVLLNRIWYTPFVVRTAQEGIHLAEKHSFTLILFDGDLPEKEMFAALSLLRTDESIRHLPVVAFIMNERSSYTASIISMGCSAVVTKPIDLAMAYGVLAQLSGQQRITPRISTRFRVEIVEESTEKIMTCINLSEGGMYLRTHEPLPEKMVLHLKFSLPHSTEKIELTGEVVRTYPLETQLENEPGMGLRFIDVPQHIELQIRNYVQWEITGDLEWEATI